MKIKNIYFLLCIFLIFIFGCKNKNHTSDASSSHIEHKIFDDLGNLKYIANYNKNLLLTQLSVFDENEKLEYQTIKLPQSNLISEERSFNQSGNLEKITQYHYLPNGNLKQKDIFSDSNELLLSCSYKYNENNELAQVNIYNNVEKKKNTITYDTSKKSASHTIFSDTGEILSLYKETSKNVFFYEYQNEKLHQATTYNKNDGSSEESLFDNLGNLISIKKFDSTNVLKEEKLYTHGVLSLRNVYRYNKQGLRTEKLEYIGNNESIEKQYIYSYDKNGLRIKMDVYDVNGKILDFFE
jgi:antitoxin component YwqK of YwqJK toxin-antitoxin module